MAYKLLIFAVWLNQLIYLCHLQFEFAFDAFKYQHGSREAPVSRHFPACISVCIYYLVELHTL